jgi:hypothetical protein
VFTIAPPPLLQHQRDLVLHAEEDAAEINADDLPFPLQVIGNCPQHAGKQCPLGRR